ncbi:amino acid ABC transporter ATP-binding/permease protein [Idiomarina xiamenensis]|uniref:ABC transporter-like protein n=1 Tax=Idiomarina xiamenensis 10-D-4 TaxID=740709 RepID=K2LCE6_9GAMM|nr:ATP-binding cassette domain-containing protein [Idiomarina xiamenensis]EKE87540.1 ABC transporter-like protein [Idiomarina xiamenensis 10-D-4]
MRDSQYLRPWLKQLLTQRRQLLLGMALAWLTTLFALGLLSLSGWFITASALYVGFDIYSPGSGIRFFAVSRTVGRYLERLVNHDLVLKLQARWRIALFKRLRQQPLNADKRFRLADTVQRLTRNIEAMDNLLLRLLLPTLVFTLLTLLVAVWWLFYQPWLALALLLTSLLVIALSAHLALRSRILAVRYTRQQQRLRSASMALTESAAELAGWGYYEAYQQRCLGHGERLQRWQDDEAKLRQRSQAWVDLVVQLLFIVVLVISLTMVNSGQLSAAQAIMLSLAALAWQETALETPQQWSSYGSIIGASRALLKPQPESDAMASSQVIQSADSDVHGRDVHSRDIQGRDLQLRIAQLSITRQQRRVVQHLNLVTEPGRVYWLQGSSGAGKSTLADTLMGLYPASNGDIKLQHRGDSSAQSMAVHCAYLTQQTDILDASIAANLRIAAPAASDEALWRVLALVELSDSVAALADGLQTRIGDYGLALSGGQLRRIALARVLLSGRPLLLLDEPFSGLQRDLAARILTRMVEQYAQRTWLIISHVSAAELQFELPSTQQLMLTPTA